MAWRSNANSPLGYPTPGAIDTTAKVAVGSIARFSDDTQGEGEFIYLPGVASLAAGDAVVYDLAPAAQAVTRLAHNAQNNTGKPVAIATAAVILTINYGWFQIGGVAVVNTVGGTVAGVAMATATTGQLGNTADAGDQVLNAQISTAVGTPAAGQSYVTLNRPCMQSQIT